MLKIAFPLAVLAITLTAPAHADVTIGVGLNVAGESEVKLVKYDCQGHDPLTVQYLNAAPNFLALIPIDGQTLIFANTLSASGAKYESGQYIWWNKGSDATLTDVTEGLDAAPVMSCTEENNTP